MNIIRLVAVACMLLLLSHAASPARLKKPSSQKYEIAERKSDVSLRRDRRFAVSAIWTAMGLIKDFTDRVTFLKGAIASVKSWFGIGDAAGTPPANEQDVLDEIEQVKDQVTDLKDDVLAGQEWNFALSVLGEPIKNLRALVFQEENYFTKVEDSNLADDIRKLAQNRFFISQVNDQACGNRRNLASLQNGILSGTGNLHKPLYEAYADKIGQQDTGTVLDVVKFIARTQQLQAHVYALLQEGVDFKPILAADKTHEDELYTFDAARVTPRQGPRIAEALNVIMAHKGSAVYGRIKAKNNPFRGKCLKRKEFSTVSGDAYVFLETCSNTDESHQWQLSEEGYIVPKSHTDQAMYFEDPGTTQNWQCATGSRKYPQPRVETKTASSTKFHFKFSTADFTIFQIQSGSNCVTTERTSGTAGLTCTKPCAEATSTSGDTWFEWEPKETS